jgi:hypothetical protein
VRENQLITGYWYGRGPYHSGDRVGGNGIFQIFDTKDEAGWREVVFNPAVVAWRADSIRNGKSTYPCPCDKHF